jgi:hypothetical protein
VKISTACLCALVACGGKLAAESDAGGEHDAAIDVVIKKDAAPVADTGTPDAGPPSGGIDVSDTGAGFESEDQIAVAPDGTIVILWQAFSQGVPQISMQYSFSTDDGKSFSPPASLTIPPGLAPGDPSVTVDANGNFWASYLGIHYQGQNVGYSRVYVASSPKGAQSFGTPVEISAPGNTTDLLDHPKIHVTSSGALLVGWADFPSFNGTTATGIVARSVDGTTWSRTTLIGPPEATFGTFFWFCEGGGELYTTFLEGTQTSGFVGLRSSGDDGVSWTSTSSQVSLDTDQIAGLDPGCVTSGPEVWVMYATTAHPSTDNTTLDGADHVWIAHSADVGVTFDPQRADALDQAADALGTLPLITMEASGRLDVAYAAGSAAGDTNGSIRFTRTTAMTVAPSVHVDGPMLFDLSRVTQTWLGDYFGGVVHAGALYLAYPNNASGQDHIFFQKLALP